MYKGDISNEIPPRFVVVFESLVASLNDVKSKRTFDKAVRHHNYRRAVQCFTVNDMVARHIWDITWNYKYAVDCATYLGPDFVEYIEEFIEEQRLPIYTVYSSKSPDIFARELNYRPDIARVFDGDPSHALMYGSKGQWVNPSEPNFFWGQLSGR